MPKGKKLHVRRQLFQNTENDQCRKRKLRCGKQKPICARCLKHNLICEYAPPPDRKRLQAERKAKAESGIISPTLSSFPAATDTWHHQLAPIAPLGANTIARRTDPSAWASSVSGYQNYQAGNWQSSYVPDGKVDLLNLIQPGLLMAYMPPPELAVSLVQVYFDHVSHARIIFNHQALLERYLQNSVPPHLVLAITAVATIFKENMRPQGLIWADLASQLVLIKADVATFTLVRTCEALAHFWFAVGEKARAKTHMNLAKNASRTLSTYSTAFSSSQKSVSTISEQYSGPEQSDLQTGYAQGSADTGFADLAHTAMALGAWRDVKLSLSKAMETRVPLHVSEVSRLDATFYEAQSALPAHIRISKLEEFQCAGNLELRGFFFTLVCVCCRLVLYSSQSAVFFIPAPPDPMDSVLYHQSIYQTVQDAGSTLAAFVQSLPGHSDTPVTVGFCAFVIGSIFCHVNRQYDFESTNTSWQRVHACLQLLTDMTPFYPNLAFFHQNLQSRLTASQNDLLQIQRDSSSTLDKMRNTQQNLGENGQVFTPIPLQEPFLPGLIAFYP